MNLLKIFIPSWRFFDRVGDRANLYYCLHPQRQSGSPWKKVLTPPPRTVFNVLLNPEGNLYLAKQGLVERLVREISEDKTKTMTPEFIEKQVSFQLVKNMVLAKIREEKVSVGSFQFMIEVTPEQGETYQVLVSEEYGCA